MVFEGIVMGATPYKDRDLIVKLLLRSGLIGNFYVYGGRGGGKHHKPTQFELGNMMKVMIKDRKNGELMVAAEYERLWEPKNIRYNIQAFYLVCLYFELLGKFAQVFELGTSDHEHDDHAGIFSVVSNALFYLDQSLTDKDFKAEQQLNLFLIKLLFHLGIMPDTDHCSFCSTDIDQSTGASFISANGQFACLQCVTAENEFGFLQRMKFGYQTKYQDYGVFTGSSFQEADKLIQYFCHQFHLRPVELKSYSLLFK
jgi:DNA repair protein RecO